MSNASGKKKTNYDTPPEVFVTVWESSNSLEEVSERTGMPKAIVSARAANYREAGVKLKKMPRKATVNVSALNEIIEQVREAGEKGDEALTPDRVRQLVEQILSSRK